MDSNDSLGNLFSNYLESLPGLYEETFDDKCSYRSNSTEDLFANTTSESGSENNQPSYVTLEAPDYVEESTQVQQVANWAIEQNEGEIELYHTVALPPHNQSNKNSRDPNSTTNQIATSLNTDGSTIQIVSPPFHIPHMQVLKTGTMT